MGRRDGGKDHQDGTVSGGTFTDGANAELVASATGRSDSDDHAYVSVRAIGARLRDDGPQAGRYNQTVDYVLIARRLARNRHDASDDVRLRRLRRLDDPVCNHPRCGDWGLPDHSCD